MLCSSIIFGSYACEPATIKSLAAFNFDFKNNSDWIEQLNNAVPRVERGIEQVAPCALTQKFPGLQNIPCLELCTLPTPVQKLAILSNSLGSDVHIKRDDTTGGQKYGGNKPRKLELEFARAMSRGATAVITFGCAGSNHAVATGEYARKLGLKAICMLKPQAPSHVVRKNLLLHQANGVELHFAPDNNVRRMATFAKWLDLINAGERPYIIPTGGSTARGTVGFVKAAFELKEQIDKRLLPKPDLIYVPCGSVATTVGILLGCKAAGLKCKIMAIAVEPEEERDEFKNNIAKLFQETNLFLRGYDSNFPALTIDSEDLEINLNFTGPEYAVFTREGIEARELLQRTEGILLDGTYTAKAFAALIDDIRSKRSQGKKVLFWNTYCGEEFSNRLASADYKKLPACFHRYFEEDVQELDRNTSKL